MMRGNGKFYNILNGLLLGAALLLTAGLSGCALRTNSEALFTGSATATVNPELPQTTARPEANTRAETQARDQILVLASQMRLPDGRTLEDVAAADATVRAELYDTVRSAHITAREVTETGSITVTLALEKAAVQRIIDHYQARGKK
jgi:hypothetical protein